MMRILFDATSIFDDQKMGLSTYSYEIVKNITKIDKSNEYFVGVRTSRWKNIQKYRDIILETGNLKILKMISFDNGSFPIAFVPRKFDIYHGLSNKLCFGPIAKRYVLTLHDTHGKKEKIKNVCKFADIIITISEFAKKKIIEEIGVDEKKIKVVYNGVSSLFTRKDEKYIQKKKEELRNKTEGAERFILCVITDDTYKKIKDIISVMEHITQKYKKVCPIFVGKNIGIQNKKWLNLGYVDKNILCDLYNIADVMFFPATMGGFGLPIIEAMACGCPVITSRGTAQDEIAGDYALKCDPNSKDEMIFVLEKILTDEKLSKELSEKGLERAKEFSWEKSAKETLKIYREIL